MFSARGVVCFITGSSWLTGPGFVGLRELVREVCDEAWVIDLGGDNHGANPEENIFAIESPVAVVVLVRDGASDPTKAAKVHYRRISGGTDEKLTAMGKMADSADPFVGEWLDAPKGWLEPFAPSTGDEIWDDMPLFTDLFPWQQPGCKFGRTWPIATTKETLERRWQRFAASSPAERPDLFFTASSGRTIATKVAGLKKLADVANEDESQPIRRYGLRSFDRQWSFQDPRMASLERPSLWNSQSPRQMFLASLLTGQISSGPGLSASAYVPDLHFFRGSFGGKDIIPLYRDAAASQPNLTAGVGRAIGTALGIAPPGVEDVAAYAYALLSASAYQVRFAEALKTPGLRVPVTADAGLWQEAVGAGRELLWLHSYAERFVDAAAGRPNSVPRVEGIGWIASVETMPETTRDIEYDPASGNLWIGDGIVSGVRPEVWDYSVSGMPVLRKWLGYRTRRGAGKAASSTSELDRIRPTEWADEWYDELLDLVCVLTITIERQDGLADLLARVCDGSLVSAAEFPVPAAAERAVPA